MITIEKSGDIWVLNLGGSPKGDGTFENSFNPEFIAAMNHCLDEVESPSCSGLVTTSTGRVFSSGLDLSWLMVQEMDAMLEFMRSFYALLLRILTLPIPTVCAINGHAFGGGFLFSLAHDYRVMNENKGFICMTEIDIGMPLTAPLNALIKEKLARRVVAKMMLEGCRFDARQSLEDNVVDFIAPANKVLPLAMEKAVSVASKGASAAFAQIKYDVYENAANSLKMHSLKMHPSNL